MKSIRRFPLSRLAAVALLTATPTAYAQNTEPLEPDIIEAPPPPDPEPAPTTVQLTFPPPLEVTRSYPGSEPQGEPCEPSAKSDADALSSQATDPTAPLMSFNFITDITTSIHGVDDHRTVFKIQPVVPFRIWGLPNILRIILPYQLSGLGPEGLNDVSLFDIAVLPVSSVTKLAIGPVFQFSSGASSNPAKVAGGPALSVIVQVSKQLTLGVFNQNLFGNELAVSQLQPIVAYQLGAGWSLSAGDLQYTFDWRGTRWTNVPLGIQVGAVYPIFGQPIRFFVGPQYNVRQARGSDEFRVSAGITLLVPR
jgi:hypothetical protein